MTTASTATNLLEFRTELPVPVERVFAALTEGDHLARWFCDEAESMAAPGGRISARWTKTGSSSQPFDGRWVVFQPPVACAYEGGHAGYPDGYAGRVGFELASRGEGAVLITRHRLPARPDYEAILADYRTAWPRALARLAAYLTPGGAGSQPAAKAAGVFAAIETTDTPEQTEIELAEAPDAPDAPAKPDDSEKPPA